MIAAARAALATAALLALACHRDIRLLPITGSDGGASGAGVAGTGVGGAGTGTGGTGGAAGAPPACVGQGPPIMLPTASGPTCAAALATRGHQFALCTCDTLNVALGLRTDAFDSTDSSVSDDVSAAVGIGGKLVTTAELRAGGAIYVAGSDGVSAAAHLQAGASFRSAGPLTMQSSQTADLLADAYVNGNLTGTVNVGGTLFVPSTATVGADVRAQPVTRETVSVLPPCDCSDGFVNLADAITAAQLNNGDAAAGFGADALATVSTTTQLPLGCGAYFLAAIDASAPVNLMVSGHALLAVAGSVNLGGGLNVMLLDQSAELDLIVGGWLTASGGTIGAPDAPARFRIWIAGTESVVFDHQPTIAAVVHAPNNDATAPLGMTVSGSLLVKSLLLGNGNGNGSGGDSEVHYDRAILSVGAACGEPVAKPIL